MSHFSKFYAISAIYFGLASAVGAQSTTSRPDSSSAQVTQDPRQDEFQHPMLEPRDSHNLRAGQKDDQSLQRRGLQGVIQDGKIRRTLPDAAPAENSVSPADRRTQDLHPGDPLSHRR